MYYKKPSYKIEGKLGADPEVKYSNASGKPFTICSIAYNERVKNEETGLWEDKPVEWYNVSAFSTLGDRLSKCKKGDSILARVEVSPHHIEVEGKKYETLRQRMVDYRLVNYGAKASISSQLENGVSPEVVFEERVEQ